MGPELNLISWPRNNNVTTCNFCGVTYNTPRPIADGADDMYTELFSPTECRHECCITCAITHTDGYTLCPVCASEPPHAVWLAEQTTK